MDAAEPLLHPPLAIKEPNPVMATLLRGVYLLPYLTATGASIMVAVDAGRRLVAQREVMSGENPLDVTEELWNTLDKADPHEESQSYSAPRLVS